MVVFKRNLDVVLEIVTKVIGLALIVRLFAAAMTMKYERPLDLLFLGASVVCVAAALVAQRVASAKAEARVTKLFVDDQHSTGTAPTQHALPLPPPPPMPSLPPTIALPREHPYPNANNATQAHSSMNPPPAWSQLQNYPPSRS